MIGQGTWENGQFVLASTKDAKIERLERENANLREERDRYVCTFRHRHLSATPLGDRCAQCGLDLRDPIHAGKF